MKQKYELNLGYVIYRKLDFLDLTYVRRTKVPRMLCVSLAAVSADSSVLRITEKVLFLQSLYVRAHLAVYNSESAKYDGIIFLWK
jgi:hypothetical protein